VFALDGTRWTRIALPHPPADATAVAAQGTDIYVGEADPAGVTVESSRDGGTSWHRRHVADATDLAGVDLSLSPNGQRLAIMLDLPSSAGAVAQASVLVTPTAGGPAVPHDAPAQGQLAWWGDRLVLSGGALSSRFFLGDATGATWKPLPVDGPVAPADDVDPGAPSFGAATTTPDGELLVPLTTHGKAPGVELYGGRGQTFRRLVRVALSGGDFGAGTAAVVAERPDGSVVIADATTPRLHVVTGSAQRSFLASGLPAAPLSLTFVTPTMGLAQVDVARCTAAKTNCTTQHEVFATADGGATWRAA
jgi:hypothetical protein